ncbi:hypothetical protein CHARACLAT_013026 [Characodon lateralis]|uniref:Uncharacterized protein n=1 Tax=Characodon lateralis TaxID=208331 RepID=A0ABU7CX49_9TELE|nr:hypothetical protein [Characodon lateralis]
MYSHQESTCLVRTKGEYVLQMRRRALRALSHNMSVAVLLSNIQLIRFTWSDAGCNFGCSDVISNINF